MKTRNLPNHRYVRDPMQLFVAVADRMHDRKEDLKRNLPARPRRALLSPPAFRAQIERRYADYRAATTEVALLNRDPSFTADQREALGACWGANAELGELKDAILAVQSDECAYCAVALSDQWDHFLPQNDDDFPEFSIFPDNLLRSCGRCNKLKDTLVQHCGQRLFIHFYYDQFSPSECFLQASFKFGEAGTTREDPPRAVFAFSKTACQSEFGRVYIRHCKKLKLIPLYNNLARSYIRGIPGELRREGRSGTVEHTAAALSEMADSLVDQHGSNYPKAVLYRAAASTPEFVAYCRRPSA